MFIVPHTLHKSIDENKQQDLSPCKFYLNNGAEMQAFQYLEPLLTLIHMLLNYLISILCTTEAIDHRESVKSE